MVFSFGVERDMHDFLKLLKDFLRVKFTQLLYIYLLCNFKDNGKKYEKEYFVNFKAFEYIFFYILNWCI